MPACPVVGDYSQHCVESHLRNLHARVEIVSEGQAGIACGAMPVDSVLDEAIVGGEIEASAEVIEQMIIQLGLADRPRLLTSYLQLFAHIKTALGLDMRDLTFKNFVGISVPPETITSFGA